MTKKILNIIETAYRGTIEEQDDPILWACTALKGAGSELSILLRGNAVNYLIKGQDASGLQLGEWKQTQPPKLDRDVEVLIQKGVEVSFVKEDAEERGLDPERFVSGVKAVSSAEVAKLCDSHDLVWHW